MRSKLTFSNVVSCLALFIALGGTSYAAVKLGKNSVKGRHIAANAVSSPKVADGSLLGRDFRAGELPAGPRGPQGGRGEKGDPGVAPQPEPWRELPFAAGWNNYGGDWVPAGFRKDQMGMVHLRGLVHRGAGTPPYGSVIATLPEGYRPSGLLLFGTHTGEPHAVGRVDIHPSGVIAWISGAGGSGNYTTLTGISFWPD